MSAPRLAVVAAGELPDPPYPREIRARGWRFELELERIHRSDTWKLAPGEIRPWLLMLWAEAWLEHPVGTLPADDRLIAATIGMPLAMFQTHREVLMRGWYRCSDGRLYHHVLTERVDEMIGKRAKDAARAETYRATKKQQVSGDVTRDSRATNALLTREFDTHHPPPTTRSSIEAVERECPSLPRAERSAARPRSEGKRATRLPDDWTLPEPWKAWAISAHQLAPTRVVQIAVVFRDYWRAKPGKDACKLDWEATWRNWIRRECGHG